MVFACAPPSQKLTYVFSSLSIFLLLRGPAKRRSSLLKINSYIAEVSPVSTFSQQLRVQSIRHQRAAFPYECVNYEPVQFLLFENKFREISFQFFNVPSKFTFKILNCLAKLS